MLCRSLMRLFFCLESHGNSDHIMKKSKLQLLNFKILGVLDVFYGVESISTIKNMIQTLPLQHFFAEIPPTFSRPRNSSISVNDS